ncbi:hypothetical protein B0H11DRAFT_1936300 [Mycena galericulata]|nr:hypothetical protein B0H11DRAFT_1936300 [Mycena galericulata]
MEKANLSVLWVIFSSILISVIENNPLEGLRIGEELGFGFSTTKETVNRFFKEYTLEFVEERVARRDSVVRIGRIGRGKLVGLMLEKDGQKPVLSFKFFALVHLDVVRNEVRINSYEIVADQVNEAQGGQDFVTKDGPMTS